MVSLCALSLSSYLQYNDEVRKKVQNVITSLLSLNIANANKPPDRDIKVDPELDNAIESFFKRIITTFISSWYSNLTHDENFVWNIKLELTEAIREIALRIKNVSRWGFPAYSVSV